MEIERIKKSQKKKEKSVITLLSTMNIENEKQFDELLKRMNVRGECLVINQINNKIDTILNLNKENKEIISFKEKGLSRSRNKAINNSKNEIGVLADDDLIYVDNYEEIIKEEYEKRPEYDIIAFYVENAQKVDALKKGKVNLIYSFKICSVQITMNLNSIKKSGILFDEKFGTGCGYFNFGEENIFLADCLKKGLKIFYSPKKIATLTLKRHSSWFNGFNREYFYARGAGYYRISKILCPILIVQFAVRKRKMYKKNMSVTYAIINMFKGIFKYKKLLRIVER